MNKILHSFRNIVLDTGSTFVETPTMIIPQLSAGLIRVKVSGTGNTSLSPTPEAYVSELVCGFRKDDNGTLYLGSLADPYVESTMLPSPTIVNNSNNIRIRFNRNSSAWDSYWIADVEIFYIQ